MFGKLYRYLFALLLLSICVASLKPGSCSHSLVVFVAMSEDDPPLLLIDMPLGTVPEIPPDMLCPWAPESGTMRDMSPYAPGASPHGMHRVMVSLPPPFLCQLEVYFFPGMTAQQVVAELNFPETARLYQRHWQGQPGSWRWLEPDEVMPLVIFHRYRTSTNNVLSDLKKIECIQFIY